MSELLTTAEAADVLRCNPSTVRAMLRAGKLAGARVGASDTGDWRIPRASLDAHLGVAAVHHHLPERARAIRADDV